MSLINRCSEEGYTLNEDIETPVTAVPNRKWFAIPQFYRSGKDYLVHDATTDSMVLLSSLVESSPDADFTVKVDIMEFRTVEINGQEIPLLQENMLPASFYSGKLVSPTVVELVKQLKLK